MGITPNMETPSVEGAEESAPESVEGQAESILDLDSVERFKFSGREWTPKDLQSAYMMQQDYSRKTQALAEDRKYSDNFAYDASKVLKDPTLLSKFAEIYPDKYVQILRESMQDQGVGMQTQNKMGTQATHQLDPELAQKLSKMEKFIQSAEQEKFQTEVQKYETEIDQMVNKFSPKYPLADQSVVLAQAELIHNRGEKLTSELWEKIYKHVHGQEEKKFNEHYKKQFDSQKQANLRGKDVAVGGGIPSQAPEKMSLKDVKTKMIADMQRARG